MNRSNAERERQDALVRMIAGAGLVLAGVALYLFLRTLPSGSAPSSEERSVVPVEVNYPAPALSLSNLHGATESLAADREQVVLVNNWATWCPPRKAEMPTLESYYEQPAAQGFTIVAIEAGDSAEEVQAFVQSHGLQFRVWLDP